MGIKEKIIKIGSAKYDNKISYGVEIIETNFKPGSGDYEDPPEVQKDQFGLPDSDLGRYFGPPTRAEVSC